MTAEHMQFPRYTVRPPEPIEVGSEFIPALIVRPEADEPRPAALVQHGYGASKADLLPLGQFLASCGFVALLPDAWGHGDRFPTSGPNWMTDFSADYIIEVLRHTVVDMSDALTALLRRPDVRPGGALLAGFSLGAIASLIVGTEDTRAAGIYSISGSPVPDLVQLMPAGMPGPSPDAERWARAHDSAEHLATLAPKPLLLQHGRNDDMVPVSGSLRLYETAQALYSAHPDNLALMLYDHRHDVTEAEVTEGVGWLLPFFATSVGDSEEDESVA
ncbi:MAG TPA: alpha/beta fold hydrolase [Ktedonobacterales bacterium]|nr:alpha/beta fold hydrolase [Ktedonobacterales bacterium]